MFIIFAYGLTMAIKYNTALAVAELTNMSPAPRRIYIAEEKLELRLSMVLWQKRNGELEWESGDKIQLF